jgi:hypothetical protein
MECSCATLLKAYTSAAEWQKDNYTLSTPASALCRSRNPFVTTLENAVQQTFPPGDQQINYSQEISAGESMSRSKYPYGKLIFAQNLVHYGTHLDGLHRKAHRGRKPLRAYAQFQVQSSTIG